MSFADDGELFGRAGLLPMMTQEAVSNAMDCFALDLTQGRDMAWLAEAARRALATTIPNFKDGPERPSNADIRDELDRLAAMAASTWQVLFTCSDAADAFLWDFTWRNRDRSKESELIEAVNLGEPPDYLRFKAALSELEWASGLLRRAMSATSVSRKQWRAPERMALRIERAHHLAPVFEAAFGLKATANNWPSGSEKKRSAFMDFYQRMVSLAFGEHETPNISGVLKAAIQHHRRRPVQFLGGVIAGL